MRALDRLSRAFATVTIYLCARVVILMCLHVAVAIAVRAIFGVSLTGTVEIVSSYYMVVLAFLPWAYAQHTGEHITVDILYSVVPRAVQKAMQFVANLISLGVVGFACHALFDMAVRQMAHGELVETGVVDIPVWPARWIAVIGAAAMIIVLLAHVLRGGRGDDDTPEQQDMASSAIPHGEGGA